MQPLLFPTQIVDEIDLRKCYVDVDKKFKGQHGIILSLRQWQRQMQTQLLMRRLQLYNLPSKCEMKTRINS